MALIQFGSTCVAQWSIRPQFAVRACYPSRLESTRQQKSKLVRRYGVIECDSLLLAGLDKSYSLSRIRNAAGQKNPKRIFEGEALLRKMNRYGLLDESQNKLERRLQTIVFKSGMAKSIHHSRVLIRQRHIS